MQPGGQERFVGRGLGKAGGALPGARAVQEVLVAASLVASTPHGQLRRVHDYVAAERRRDRGDRSPRY